MRGSLLACALVAGCAAGETDEPIASIASIDEAATVCGVGPTVKGVDVSYYQGTIDWARVAADDVKFAFVRISDGATFMDPKFATNWAGSRANGIKRGAYQFFRPGQDPIEQAEILLDAIGRKLEPDDLPPVIDVEASDGESPASIEQKVRLWISHVKGVLGRDPIIYTGFYFWRDSVGAPDITGSPLWHAQYSSASCPNIAPPWQDWAFWQFTSTGSVDGISGDVDVNRFNGDESALGAMLGAPATDEPCGTIGYAGAVIDDGDKCFEEGGPDTGMRHVSDAGKDGDLVWTHTTSDDVEANYGQWHLYFEEGGTYQVEVYTSALYARSKQAKYAVQAGATTTDVVIDQTAVDGYQSLGTFAFEAGGEQWVRVADNTGEPLTDKVQLVFDALRVTRMEAPPPDVIEPPGDEGGCNAGGSGVGGLFGLALIAAVGTRRRTLAALLAHRGRCGRRI